MAGFLLEIFINFGVYGVGYLFAVSFFPWVSSGRIVVQPYSSEYFYGWYRHDDFGRIEIATEGAALLGFLILVALFVASYFLLRAIFEPVPSAPRTPFLSGSVSLPLDVPTSEYLRSLSGN